VDNLKNGITAQEYKTKVEDLLETLPDAENQNMETAWKIPNKQYAKRQKILQDIM
jgi:hypothetical protein